MQISRQIAWGAAIAFAMTLPHARAQDFQVSCDQYARDYSNMVAPRSGGAAVSNPMYQHPGSSAPNTQRLPQVPGNNEWQHMVPNQGSYRMAYDRCINNRR
jgi:hypothetical protein